MDWKIPLFKIYHDEQDTRLVQDAIQRGTYWAMGPCVEQFEKLIASYLGVKHALVFNSGTSALHAAMLAYGIGPGDEVIVPSFTFIATANAPLFTGARPVFADIEKKTFGLDPRDVECKITSKTRAIIPIHFGGCPCFIKELAQLARNHNLILIEDAAEALGASVKGSKVGTFGDCAILSFCANKIASTGEGGAIVTGSTELYEKLKLLRSHGREDNGNYFSSNGHMDYITLGYNFRMSDITAALGIAQFTKLEKLIAMRQEKAAYYSDHLKALNGIEPHSPPADCRHVYQMYTVRVSGEDGLRDMLAKELAAKGILTKVYFSPVHQTSFYHEKLGYTVELPVTEKVSQQVLTLPLYPDLTQDEMDYIIESIRAFLSQRGSKGSEYVSR